MRKSRSPIQNRCGSNINYSNDYGKTCIIPDGFSNIANHSLLIQMATFWVFQDVEYLAPYCIYSIFSLKTFVFPLVTVMQSNFSFSAGFYPQCIGYIAMYISFFAVCVYFEEHLENNSTILK